MNNPESPYHPEIFSESDDALAHFQPMRIELPPPAHQKHGAACACLLPVLLAAGMCLVGLAVYLLNPAPITFLVLGIDRSPPGTALGRSDTIILTRVEPRQPAVKLLSIPRDLWVPIPGAGNNRINTAHFFAESRQPGSGPAAAAQVVENQLGVPVRYTVRLKFDAVVEIVDALGGIDIELPTRIGDLHAGKHHLDGTAVLKLARDRQGADDFYRMEHAQLLIRAVISRLLTPAAWQRLPALYRAVVNNIDTTLPLFELPRIGLAVLRAGKEGIDARSIPREMTIPTTINGAQVLLPRWERIRPLVQEMFGLK